MSDDVEDQAAAMERAVDVSRRQFLRAVPWIAGVGVLGGAAASAAESAAAQTSGQTPWWPSRWGAGDEAGASNWITPEKVLDTVKWIRDGKIYRLGHDYAADMPRFLQRSFSLRVPGAPTAGTFGANRVVANEDFVCGDLGQVGTTLDGLGHIGMRFGEAENAEPRYYNGYRQSEIGSANGLRKLGVERIKPIFTRGHLIDAAGLKGRRLAPAEEITVADIRAALQRQRMKESDIKEGDAILFRTGHGQLWQEDPSRYYGEVPGIGMEVARWVIDKGLCLTGADTQCVEVLPSKVPDMAFPVHAELQTRHGILNAEDLTLEDLARDGKFQFAYVFSPVPLRGATGSPGCPLAVT